MSSKMPEHPTSAKATLAESAHEAITNRAQLILQMASSVEMSNLRREKQIETIDNGNIKNIQDVIDEIMDEKPVSLMELLQATEPDVLPTTQVLRAKYGRTNGEDREGGNVTTNQQDVHKSAAAAAAAAVIAAAAVTKAQPDDEDGSGVSPTSAADYPMPTSLAPLQEQLKRSYEAIIKLRENSDSRYQALEQQYLQLKNSDRPRQAIASDDSDQAFAAAQAMAENAEGGPLKEQLKQCYAAIVRLRENTDLRYNVLESKYVDLKRSHAEIDARRERAEAQNEKLKAQVQQLKTEKKKLQQTHKKLLANANQVKQKAVTDYHNLCRLVLLCDDCEQHIDDSVIAALTGEEIPTDVVTGDDDHEPSELVLEDDIDAAEAEDSSISTADDNDIKASHPNQEAAKAILGKDLVEVVDMDVDENDLTMGKFANLSESGKEQKLRGHHSQFVAAQSGVYCKIDHDMNKKYGDLNKISPPEPPSPPQLKLLSSPASEKPVVSQIPPSTPPLMRTLVEETVDVDELDEESPQFTKSKEDDTSVASPVPNEHSLMTPPTPPRAATPPRPRQPKVEKAPAIAAAFSVSSSPGSSVRSASRPKRSSLAPKRNKRNEIERQNKLQRKISFGEIIEIPAPVYDEEEGHEEEKTEIEAPNQEEGSKMPGSIERNSSLEGDAPSVGDQDGSESGAQLSPKRRVSAKLSAEERKARRDSRLKEAKKSAKAIQKKAREVKKAEGSTRGLLSSTRGLNSTDASDNGSVLSNLTGDSGSKQATTSPAIKRSNTAPVTSTRNSNTAPAARKSWKGLFKTTSNTVVASNRMAGK